jgi:hypothetical protein
MTTESLRGVRFFPVRLCGMRESRTGWPSICKYDSFNPVMLPDFPSF